MNNPFVIIWIATIVVVCLFWIPQGIKGQPPLDATVGIVVLVLFAPLFLLYGIFSMLLDVGEWLREKVWH